MDQAESLEAFFHDRVGHALRSKGVSTGAMTEHYLVRLLSAYATQPDAASVETPLALKLLEALSGEPPKRRARLREVGDTALFVSSFFSESRATRVVDVDYYIGVGGSAYGELARGTSDGWRRDPNGDVYGELAENFGRFVDALSALSAHLVPSTPQDIVRLYDKWKETGSAWAAQKLALLGVTTQTGGNRPQ